MYDFVFRNTRKRGNIVDLIAKARLDNMGFTVIACERHSNLGKIENIFILTSGTYTPKVPLEIVSYITDTGRNLGGKGVCVVQACCLISPTSGVRGSLQDNVDWNKKRPIYVMV